MALVIKWAKGTNVIFASGLILTLIPQSIDIALNSSSKLIVKVQLIGLINITNILFFLKLGLINIKNKLKSLPS